MLVVSYRFPTSLFFAVTDNAVSYHVTPPGNGLPISLATSTNEELGDGQCSAGSTFPTVSYTAFSRISTHSIQVRVQRHMVHHVTPTTASRILSAPKNGAIWTITMVANEELGHGQPVVATSSLTCQQLIGQSSCDCVVVVVATLVVLVAILLAVSYLNFWVVVKAAFMY